MKIVIDIPDEAYELLKNKQVLDNIAESIIANGTPYKERPQGNLISSLTELCNGYCKNCPVADNSNDCTDCICTHIRGIIGEEAENE